jgi:cysteine desulfurase
MRRAMIYLDHNATTPIAPEVLEAMMPYLTTEWGNPSSSYKFGSKLKSVVEVAREQVAQVDRGVWARGNFHVVRDGE